jgi:hypothetical protein
MGWRPAVIGRHDPYSGQFPRSSHTLPDHTGELVANQNHAAYISGILLVAEIVTPVVIPALALYQRRPMFERHLP